MLHQRSKHVYVRGQIPLGECGHNASRIGQQQKQSRSVTDRQLATDPVVLDEPRFSRTYDHVHPKATLIKACLRPKLVQPIESRGRQNGDGKQVEE
jgi:hypothetical protein